MLSLSLGVNLTAKYAKFVPSVDFNSNKMLSVDFKVG
jgi:hypothetical protein